MTQTSEIQKLLEAADFEPKECIQQEPPLYEAQGRPVAIISLMSILNSAFPSFTLEHKGQQRVGIDSDDVHESKGEAAVYTIDEIYARVASNLYPFMRRTKGAHGFVLCCDKASRIVPEKRAEQQDRDRRAAPYPPTATLSAAGITVDGETGDVKPSRLMATRGLRVPLFRLLLEKLKTDPRLRGMVVYADLTEDPPVEIHDGKHAEYKGSVQIETVGEDDLTMPLWGLHLGEQHPRLFYSVDRDMLCILLLHWRLLTRHHPVWLQYGDGRTVDIAACATKLENAGWTMPWFVAACCLAGKTDFTKKKWLTQQINAKSIIACSLACCKAGLPLPITEGALRSWLRVLYSLKMHQTHVLSERALAELGKVGKIQYPEAEDRDKAVKGLRFLFAYWQSLHFTKFSREQAADDRFLLAALAPASDYDPSGDKRKPLRAPADEPPAKRLKG